MIDQNKPYHGKHIQEAKQAYETIKSLLEPLITQAKDEAVLKIDELIKELQKHEDFQKIPTADRYKVIRPREELKKSISLTTSIDTIKQRTNTDALLQELDRGLETMFSLIGIVPKKLDTVKITTLTPTSKRRLKSSEDVKEYIQTLQETLLKEIDDGKHILL